MITSYYMPEVVKKWKDKKATPIWYMLYEMRANGDRIVIDKFNSIAAARVGKAKLEKFFPLKNFVIIGGKIKCK